MKRLLLLALCFTAALCLISCRHGKSGGSAPEGPDVSDRIRAGTRKPSVHLYARSAMPANRNIFLAPGAGVAKNYAAVIDESFKKILPLRGCKVTEKKADAGILLSYIISKTEGKRMSITLNLTASAPDGKVLWEGETRVKARNGAVEPYLPGLVVCAVHYFGKTASHNIVSLPKHCPDLLNAVYQ